MLFCTQIIKQQSKYTEHIQVQFDQDRNVTSKERDRSVSVADSSCLSAESKRGG